MLWSPSDAVSCSAMHKSIVARCRALNMPSPSSWSHVSTLPLRLRLAISITLSRAGFPQPGELIAVEIEMHEQFRRAIHLLRTTRFAAQPARIRLAAALLIATGNTEAGVIEIPAR